MGSLSAARLSLEEAMVLEEMRGLPVEQAQQVLGSLQQDLATLGLPPGHAHANAQARGSHPGQLGQPGGAPAGRLPPAGLTGPGDDKRWLTIGIPTVPRKDGQDYLTRCAARRRAASPPAAPSIPSRIQPPPPTTTPSTPSPYYHAFGLATYLYSFDPPSQRGESFTLLGSYHTAPQIHVRQLAYKNPYHKPLIGPACSL